METEGTQVLWLKLESAQNCLAWDPQCSHYILTVLSKEHCEDSWTWTTEPFVTCLLRGQERHMGQTLS